MMLPEQYRKSLKMPEAEEFFDLVFFRPSAYFLVLPLSKTPITPNQITGLSLIAGCIAAYYLYLATPAAWVVAAMWYAIANILDCADGQLARINKNGTPLGRIIDGVADYISSVAIFLCIGFGFAHAGYSQWWLVIAGGLSSALHAIKFDDAQGRFISIVRGEEDFSSREIEKYSALVTEHHGAQGSGLRLTVMKMYLSYLLLQQRVRSVSSSKISAEQFRKANAVMIRYWTVLGPTTNRTILMLCALLGNVEMFLWLVFIPGNLWLAFCMIAQRRIDTKLARSIATPDFSDGKQ